MIKENLETCLNDLAVAAGQAILTVYEKPFAADHKKDGSPVTEADTLAEDIILERLTREFPDIPIVAEESVEAGNLPKVGNRFFLVDPLDGTKEFLKKNGEFTVNIALVENGFPICGVVYAPALEQIYWGSKTGAYTANTVDGEIGEQRRMQVRALPEQGLSVLASRSHISPETSKLIEKLSVSELLSVGSSLKLCWLAEGKADLYPRLAPTMQWDIAAGHAVLRAAGGHLVKAKNGAEFIYTVPENATKSDLLNDYFFAFADRSLIDVLV